MNVLMFVYHTSGTRLTYALVMEHSNWIIIDLHPPSWVSLIKPVHNRVCSNTGRAQGACRENRFCSYLLFSYMRITTETNRQITTNNFGHGVSGVNCYIFIALLLM